MSLRRCMVGWLLGATIGWVCGHPAIADEPVQAFLDELRRNGYYEEALNYLNDMATSPVAPASFKDVLEYERAKTLLASLSEVRDKTRQESILDAAQRNLDAFITEHRTHPLVGEATELFANLLIKRSELNQEEAEQETISEAQRSALLVESRDHLQKAREIFEQRREDLKASLLRIDPKTTDAQLKSMLQDYRVRYMQIRLNLPQTRLLLAKTFPPDAAEYQELARQAGIEFDEVREAYQAYQGTALLATIGKAEALAMQGQCESAQSSLAVVFELPQTAELRELKRRGLEIALQCWREQETFPYAEALPLMEGIAGTLLPAEMSEPKWLRLQLELARRYREAAMQLEAQPSLTPEQRNELKQYQDRSESLARDLTKNRSPVKAEAQQLLAEWGLAKPPSEPAATEPQNFLQARDRAIAVLTDYDNARVAVETLEQALQQAPDPATEAELQSQLRESQQVLNTAPARAMALFEQALKMADSETPQDDLAIVRRYQAYLYLIEDRFFQAGVIGSYQLATAPTAAGSQASGAIALNAYWSLFQQQGADQDRSFERQQLESIAAQILKYYPGTDEAVKAANIMFFLSLLDQDLAQAQDYLVQMPEGSPERKRAELALGTQVWARYLIEKNELVRQRQAETLSEETFEEQLQGLTPQITEARSWLEPNVPRLTPDEMETGTVNAALALCQLWLAEDQSDEAVSLLEQPETGLLTLAKQKHPSLDDPSVLEQVYRTALRAYVNSLAGADDPEQRVQAARGVMQALAAMLGQREGGQQELINLYVDLLANLKTDLETARNPLQRQSLARGVGTFLKEVFGASNDPKVLGWAAKTAIQVASVLTQQDEVADAQALLETVEAKLQGVVERAKDEELRLQWSADLAVVKRMLGKYAESINLYAEVLAQKPTLVSVQVQAAETYHQWARAIASKELLIRAMTGGEPREQRGRNENAIWGWIKIAKVTAPSQPFRETFLRACFSQAYARFEYAKLTESEKILRQAQSDIRTTARIAPDYGGDVWRARFEILMKAIQRELGEPETGLEEPAAG